MAQVSIPHLELSCTNICMGKLENRRWVVNDLTESQNVHMCPWAHIHEHFTVEGTRFYVPRRLDPKHARCLAQVRWPRGSLLRHRMREQVAAIVHRLDHLAHLMDQPS